MPKKLTKDEFVSKAQKVHRYRYDYSLADYVNSKTSVKIICPIHGIFEQTPNNHLKGFGCRFCKYEYQKTLIYGVGINDSVEHVSVNRKLIPSYNYWVSMLRRCYNNDENKNKTYKGCTVCEEWKYFSNFKCWFEENYVDGWEIDKDILVKGNRIYSPKTCCFVPHEINSIFTKSNRRRGCLPIGVYYNKRNKKYATQCNVEGYRRGHFGYYNTKDEAFQAYKRAKEEYIKAVADKWKDEINPRVYDALYNYEVEITD